MKLEHLEYAIEIAKTGSITQAAENLFMMQPNLSKAIQELEESVGLKIFSRNRIGTFPTPEGEAFLKYATDILEQVYSLEARYQKRKTDVFCYKISVPRASYITHSFASFMRGVDWQKEFNVFFHEASNGVTIANLLERDYDFGMIRYPTVQERYYMDLLEYKGLKFKHFWEFEYMAIMHQSHPLAEREKVSFVDLNDSVEIQIGDIEVANFSPPQIKRTIPQGLERHRITIYERASQFELLTQIPGSYVMGSPLPKDLLDRYSLVVRPFLETDRTYKDIFIFKDESLLEKDVVQRCVAQLTQTRDAILEDLGIALAAPAGREH
ncbi:LysR family transcriptional regulator [Oscillospiraceae bacterium MB08-C2-2]|nr:LysR family transcriptional regulator [Oscillospiraceae bacterium MB08-C2-2]